jgi:hypothetical protein
VEQNTAKILDPARSGLRRADVVVLPELASSQRPEGLDDVAVGRMLFGFVGDGVGPPPLLVG